jgi:hypothetical protein
MKNTKPKQYNARFQSSNLATLGNVSFTAKNNDSAIKEAVKISKELNLSHSFLSLYSGVEKVFVGQLTNSTTN